MDLNGFLEKPCRFRLKSGREIYGVIRKAVNATSAELLFASNKDYSRFLRAEISDGAFFPLQRDEIVAAELLEDLIGRGTS